MLHLTELGVNEFQHGRPGSAVSPENLQCGWKMDLNPGLAAQRRDAGEYEAEKTLLRHCRKANRDVSFALGQKFQGPAQE
jgi:hypothetical protein